MISWGEGGFRAGFGSSTAGWLVRPDALLQPGWRQNPKGQSSGGRPREEEKELRPCGLEGGAGAM